jgi:hypothetical protein
MVEILQIITLIVTGLTLLVVVIFVTIAFLYARKFCNILNGINIESILGKDKPSRQASVRIGKNITSMRSLT